MYRLYIVVKEGEVQDMIGQDLINYIEEGNLQDRHFFIDVEGYVSTIDSVLETNNGDIVLAQEDRGIIDVLDDPYNRERYFSEWFNIIPYSDAKQLWEDGDRSFLVLRSDGTDAYADSYENFEDIPHDSYFGFDK